MELGYRHPTGPLELTDLVGLDVRLAILDHLTKEIGEPLCPVWDGCTQVGTAPRSEAIAKGRQSEDTASFTCKTSPKSSFPSVLGLGALASFLGLVVVRARKKS